MGLSDCRERKAFSRKFLISDPPPLTSMIVHDPGRNFAEDCFRHTLA
jgi:hypothetical protein